MIINMSSSEHGDDWISDEQPQVPLVKPRLCYISGITDILNDSHMTVWRDRLNILYLIL